MGHDVNAEDPPVSCSHSTTCPLFPHLHSSLAGWKRAYCDSESGWQSCARYELSLKGESAPLSLLPNGKTVQIMSGAADDTASADSGTKAESEPGKVAVATAQSDELVEAVPQSWWKRMFGRSGS